MTKIIVQEDLHYTYSGGGKIDEKLDTLLSLNQLVSVVLVTHTAINTFLQ